MKKYEIVKKHEDFDNIIHNGKYKKSKNFIIYNKDSEYNYPRFGLAVGKKIGNAVIRNKMKRYLRIIIDKNKNLFKINKDYIIIIKKSSTECSLVELEDELIKLYK